MTKTICVKITYNYNFILLFKIIFNSIKLFINRIKIVF